MRFLGVIFLVFTFVFTFCLESYASYEYVEQFNTTMATLTNNGWKIYTFRGRSAIFYGATNNVNGNNDPSSYPWNAGGTPSAFTVGNISVGNNSLIIYGRGNNANLVYNNYWTGNSIKFIPASNTSIARVINATPENPFGFTVVHRMSRIDNLSDARGQTGYHQAAINIWLAQENGRTNEWENYDNYVLLYQEMVSGNATVSEWGYYKGGKNQFNLAGTFYDNWGNGYSGFGSLRVNMQDNNLNYLNMNFYGGSAGTTYANTSVFGVKITHDGSKVSFYFNPSPYANTGSWYKMAETSVGWYSNLVVEFGHESLIFVSESQEAYWDDFTIRTVTSNTVAYITPSKTVVNSTNIYTIVISNDITSYDSGIGEIKVTKPAEFGAWDTNAVWVETYYITGSATNNRIFSGEPGANQFLVRVIPSDPNSLLIRFRMVSASDNRIITSSTPNKTIKVSFRLVSPSIPNTSGEYKFYAYVDCSKSPNTGNDIRYATTGWKRAVDLGMSVSVYDKPFVFAGLSYSPTPMYEGDDVYQVFYDISTSGLSNRPNIGIVEIAIPNGFVVSNALSSLLIGTNNIFLTNYNGTNRIRVNYVSSGSSIPGQNGLERITFYIVQTPDLPIGILKSNFVWPMWVYDEFGNSAFLGGTNTNSIYRSQNTEVIIISPQLVAYVNPPKVDNAVKTNTFAYSVINNGPLGNDIRDIFILFDTNYITNYAWGLSNAKPTYHPAQMFTTNIDGLGFGVFVRYTNSSKLLRSGSNDIIYFTTIHKRTNVDDPPVWVNFVGYADNGNGEGLVVGKEYSPNSWRVGILPPDPDGVASLSTNYIDTTVVYFTITNFIYNTGASGNNMKYGIVSVPSGFGILGATSSWLSNPANVQVTGTNVILHYSNEGVGLRSVYENPNYKDIVVLTLTNTNYFVPANLRIQSYLGNNRGVTNLGDKSPSETQDLFVVWPNLVARANIKVTQPPDSSIEGETKIDVSTTTNQITYVVSNLGASTGSKNIIYTIKINIPTDVSTNVIDISSTIVTNPANARFISSGNYILVDYISEGTNLQPGRADTITFKMIDFVENEIGIRNFIIFASNQKALQQITNGNFSIEFKMPPAFAGAKFDSQILYTTPTNRIDNIKLIITNAGKGSNRLYRVRVDIPQVYNSRIKLVQSSIVGTSVTITPSNFLINYSSLSTNLPAGMVDEVMIMFSNNFSSPTNGQFLVYATNVNVNAESLVTNIIYSTNENYIYITEMPLVSVVPTNVYTTSNTNEFIIYLTNGNNSSSKEIYRTKIYLPQFINESNLNVSHYLTSLPSYPSLYILTNERAIVIDFALSKLTGSKFYSMKVTAVDSFNYGETNVYWRVYADYNDGYSNNNFPYSFGGVTNLFFKLPPTRAYAKLVPNVTYNDFTRNTLKVVITNYGEKYNDIYLARIYLPPVITNVLIISNKVPASITYQQSSNVIILNYSVSNTNISSTKFDEIWFVAYDNVNYPSTYSSNIIVQVANYPSNVYYTNASELVLGDLAYRIEFPPYNANYYVIPNQVSAFENSFVNYTIYLQNVSSSSDYKIEKVEVIYPFMLLTNGMVVNSSYHPSASKVITSSNIVIDYTSKLLTNNASEVITISAKDSWIFGNTNVYFYVKVKYTTNEEFVDAHVSGGTNLVSFISSGPVVYGNFVNNDIYMVNPRPLLRLSLSNGGSGDNLVSRIDITIPSTLTNNFDPSTVSNSLITNVSYNSSTGVLTIYMTNFYPGIRDIIYFNVSNTLLSSSTNEFQLVAYNVVTNESVIPSYLNALNIRFVSQPAGDVITRELSTLDKTNNVIVRINNDSVGNSPIVSAVITLKWPFTNVIGVSNTKPSTITISNDTNIYIRYSFGIEKGDNDLIYIDAIDVFDIGQTNSSIGIRVSEGAGFVGVREGVSGTNVLFVMPRAYGLASLLTKYVVIADPSKGQTSATNSVDILVTNTGSGLNYITTLKIVLPNEITNIFSITSSLPAIYSNSNNVLFVHYTNGGIPTSSTDVIRFVFEEYYLNSVEKRLYVYADNGLDDYQNLDPMPGGTLTLKFDFPQEPADYYIVASSSIAYTIDTNHTIVLRINNNSYSYPITRVKINYDPSTNFTIVNIRASNYITLNSWQTNSNYILLDVNIPTRSVNYGGSFILIDIVYNQSTNVTNDMIAQVYYDGAEDFENVNVPLTETSKFKILFANFGRILGLVKPYYRDISVKVVYRDTTTVVTNEIDGNFIVSSLTTNIYINNVLLGSYTLNFIPPGIYDIVFTSAKYRTLTIKGVKVLANSITNLELVILSNAPFSTESREEQSVVSLDDGNTAIIVPPGSLLNDFSVDIILRYANAEEQRGVLNTKSVAKFDNLSGMKVYELVMKSVPGHDIFENPLKSDVILKFYYDENYIRSQGWSEDNISIWYWKDTTKEWVRIGGLVDKQNNFIYIKTRYLHRVYAIIGNGNIKTDGIVRNVKASPNPFTPQVKNTSVDNKYGMLKITFDLDKPYDKYKVKIYDMSGKLVRILEGDGSFGQGEVYWDGKDHDGVYVRNGAYLFVVIAGDTVGYKGTVILVK
ncbi:MAG: FlgD immunoglobulin-like domain containing protein [Brevinematia bacterium]